jgi:hypothetical protein
MPIKVGYKQDRRYITVRFFQGEIRTASFSLDLNRINGDFGRFMDEFIANKNRKREQISQFEIDFGNDTVIEFIIDGERGNYVLSVTFIGLFGSSGFIDTQIGYAFKESDIGQVNMALRDIDAEANNRRFKPRVQVNARLETTVRDRQNSPTLL